MAIRYRLLLLGAVLLLSFFAFQSLDVFPLPKDDIISQKSQKFSGVLRLWIYEENSPASPSAAPWLIRESAQFEKKHDGVYVQVSEVSRETLASFSYAAELPPDMIVFSPGTLESAVGLIHPGSQKDLLNEFTDYADGFAIPIAAGAHAWAVRADAPDPGQVSGKTIFIEEGDEKSALYALSSDAPKTPSYGMQFGLDLGLPAPENSESAPLVIEESSVIIPGEGSRITKNAHLSFIKGDCSALLVSGKTLSKIINASSAPDFKIISAGEMYIDALSLFAITDTPEDSKRDMCVLFLEHLLDKEAQARLSSCGAFSVRDDLTLYPAKKHFSDMEMYLHTLPLIPAPAFERKDVSSEKAKLSELFSAPPSNS